MSTFFKKLKNAFVETISPTSRCMLCGVDVFDESGFCEKCLSKVTFNNGKTCLRCGVALHGEENYCGNCAFDKVYFDRAYSPLCYGGGVQQAILSMKYSGFATNAKVFAGYLARCCEQNRIQFDVVTFVPMTKISQKRRGYNQARLLAESFCDIMKAEPPRELLFKVKDTVPQENLGHAERKENLIAAFAAKEDLHGKTVLVIDDVKTTGATLNECAKALKKKGAQKVVCLTVASREEHVETEK